MQNLSAHLSRLTFGLARTLFCAIGPDDVVKVFRSALKVPMLGTADKPLGDEPLHNEE